MPIAARLMLAGELCILLAICDFGARLLTYERAGAIGSILRLGDIGPSLSASAVLLVAAVIGLDYMERRSVPRQPK